MYERTPESRRAEYERRKQRGGVRKQWVMKAYGLSWEDYQGMVEAQDNKCAICGNPEMSVARRKTGEPRPLSVDHNHKTMRVRGLLCRACNHLVGNCQEDIQILLAAIDYLKEYEEHD